MFCFCMHGAIHGAITPLESRYFQVSILLRTFNFKFASHLCAREEKVSCIDRGLTTTTTILMQQTWLAVSARNNTRRVPFMGNHHRKVSEIYLTISRLAICIFCIRWTFGRLANGAPWDECLLIVATVQNGPNKLFTWVLPEEDTPRVHGQLRKNWSKG